MVGLRELAEVDMGVILEDGVYGFGYPVKVTNPAGMIVNLTGFSNDINQFIDPDTGQAVSGRIATVALRISSLTAAGLGLPTNISNAAKKPWVIEFNDINGGAHKFKVQEGNPDRAIGLIICMLELYK